MKRPVGGWEPARVCGQLALRAWFKPRGEKRQESRLQIAYPTGQAGIEALGNGTTKLALEPKVQPVRICLAGREIQPPVEGLYRPRGWIKLNGEQRIRTGGRRIPRGTVTGKEFEVLGEGLTDPVNEAQWGKQALHPYFAMGRWLVEITIGQYLTAVKYKLMGEQLRIGTIKEAEVEPWEDFVYRVPIGTGGETTAGVVVRATQKGTGLGPQKGDDKKGDGGR